MLWLHVYRFKIRSLYCPFDILLKTYKISWRPHGGPQGCCGYPAGTLLFFLAIRCASGAFSKFQICHRLFFTRRKPVSTLQTASHRPVQLPQHSWGCRANQERKFGTLRNVHPPYNIQDYSTSILQCLWGIPQEPCSMFRNWKGAAIKDTMWIIL